MLISFHQFVEYENNFGWCLLIEIGYGNDTILNRQANNTVVDDTDADVEQICCRLSLYVFLCRMA